MKPNRDFANKTIQAQQVLIIEFVKGYPASKKKVS
jgi:hypothetical protein